MNNLYTPSDHETSVYTRFSETLKWGSTVTFAYDLLPVSESVKNQDLKACIESSLDEEVIDVSGLLNYDNN